LSRREKPTEEKYSVIDRYERSNEGKAVSFTIIHLICLNFFSKAAQKIHFAWNFIFQNLQAVVSHNPNAGVNDIAPEHLMNSESSSNGGSDEATTKHAEEKKEEAPEETPNEDKMDVEEEKTTTTPPLVVTPSPNKPVVSSKQSPGKEKPKEETKEVKSTPAVTPATQKPVASPSKTPVVAKDNKETEKKTEEKKEEPSTPANDFPKESELLKSSQEAKKHVATMPMVNTPTDQISLSQLTELPEVLTTTAFSWTILMIIDPQVQLFISRFLAVSCYKALKEKISAASADQQFVLARDPFLRFICQLLQVSCAKDLQFHAVDDQFVRIYLPLVVVDNSGDKSIVEKMLAEHPLSEESCLDGTLLKVTLEKFLLNLKAVRNKAVADSK
jgi:hypothetical protein